MKRLAPLAVMAALAATPVLAQAPAAPERLVDAAKVFAFLDKFYAVPPAERSLLALHYRLTHEGKPATDVHLTLVVGGKRTPIPVGAEGQVERLPTSAELAQHAQVAIEAPQGAKFGSHLSLDAAIKPAAELSAADCATAVAQANAAISRAAGIMAMIAPKVKATTFPGSGSGVAVMADGKTTSLPVVKGAPSFDPAIIKGAKTIKLAKAPSVVSLD